MAVHVQINILYVAVMTVKLSVKPTLDEIKAEYKARGERLADTTPAHKKVSIYLDQWVQRNFKDGGSKLGADSWPEFSFGGRAIPDEFYDEDNPPPGNFVFTPTLSGFAYWIDSTAKLLQNTGRLKFSFLPFATQRDAGVGSELKYSKYHNDRKDKWKRRILPLDIEVEERIREILENHGRKSLGIKR